MVLGIAEADVDIVDALEVVEDAFEGIEGVPEGIKDVLDELLPRTLAKSKYKELPVGWKSA